MRTTGIVFREYEGNGRPVNSHISRESRVTNAMRSDAVAGQGGSLASRLRSGTTRTVMSRRWFVMLKGNMECSFHGAVSQVSITPARRQPPTDAARRRRPAWVGANV